MFYRCICELIKFSRMSFTFTHLINVMRWIKGHRLRQHCVAVGPYWVAHTLTERQIKFARISDAKFYKIQRAQVCDVCSVFRRRSSLHLCHRSVALRLHYAWVGLSHQNFMLHVKAVPNGEFYADRVHMCGRQRVDVECERWYSSVE